MPHRGFFHIHSHTRPPGPHLGISDVALSLTVLKDGHNTLYDLEGRVTPFQSVEYLREPIHQTFLSSWSYGIVLRICVSQSLHELGMSDQLGAGLVYLGHLRCQGYEGSTGRFLRIIVLFMMLHIIQSADWLEHDLSSHSLPPTLEFLLSLFSFCSNLQQDFLQHVHVHVLVPSSSLQFEFAWPYNIIPSRVTPSLGFRARNLGFTITINSKIHSLFSPP